MTTRIPGRSYAIYVQGFAATGDAEADARTDRENPVLYLSPVQIARYEDSDLVTAVNEMLVEKGSQKKVTATGDLDWQESTQADGTIVMVANIIARAQTKGLI